MQTLCHTNGDTDTVKLIGITDYGNDRAVRIWSWDCWRFHFCGIRCHIGRWLILTFWRIHSACIFRIKSLDRRTLRIKMLWFFQTSRTTGPVTCIPSTLCTFTLWFSLHHSPTRLGDINSLSSVCINCFY